MKLKSSQELIRRSRIKVKIPGINDTNTMKYYKLWQTARPYEMSPKWNIKLPVNCTETRKANSQQNNVIKNDKNQNEIYTVHTYIFLSWIL